MDRNLFPNNRQRRKSGTQTKNSGRKKGRKKKLTAADKELKILEDGAAKIKNSRDDLIQLTDRINKWLAHHAVHVINLFQNYDRSGDCVITNEKLKYGLTDLGIPCSKIELHLLLNLLEHDGNGKINYQLFKQGIADPRERQTFREDTVLDETASEKVHLTCTNQMLDHCSKCGIGIEIPIKDDSRFVQLHMKLATFEKIKEHPFHLNFHFPSTITIETIVYKILDHTDLPTRKVAVFSDRTLQKEFFLAHHYTLEECGYHGGPWQTPEEVLLYYDLNIEFSECPILMTDHYF